MNNHTVDAAANQVGEELDLLMRDLAVNFATVEAEENGEPETYEEAVVFFRTITADALEKAAVILREKING